jgi:CDGSH-type Zn-finger protein
MGFDIKQLNKINMTNNNLPHIAKKAPYKTTVEKDKIYSICSCGYSKKQPFCDGSHQEEAPSYRSIKYLATENKEVYFCGCKYSKNMPLCNGAHNDL